MCFNKHNIDQVKFNFSHYVFSIKEDLLNQIISKESNSRTYFENYYNQLFYKYLDTINILNYHETCGKFINNVYGLIPIDETI